MIYFEKNSIFNFTIYFVLILGKCTFKFQIDNLNETLKKQQNDEKTLNAELELARNKQVKAEKEVI